MASVIDTAICADEDLSHCNRSGFYRIFGPQFFECLHFSASPMRFAWQRMLSSPLIT